MDTPGVLLPKDRQTTEVDKLRRQATKIRGKIATITADCHHEWKLVGHREMRKTLVPGIWQYTVGRAARVMCKLCSKREERRLFEICPICAGTDFTTTQDKHIKYFGPVLRHGSDEIANADQTVKIYCCNGCGHSAVDASRTYLHTDDDQYVLARPVTADKL